MQVATVICFDTMTASRWLVAGWSGQSSTDRDGGAAITGESLAGQKSSIWGWVGQYGSIQQAGGVRHWRRSHLEKKGKF